VVYRVVRSEDAGRDLQVILEHLIESHLGFGEAPAEALPLAAACMGKIHDAMARLGKQPHQGSLEPALLPDIRHVTKDRAISYFTVDDAAELVTVLAIFFGAQDHQRAMLKRIMGR
jgi:plasmid stabilization system protein ParE